MIKIFKKLILLLIITIFSIGIFSQVQARDFIIREQGNPSNVLFKVQGDNGYIGIGTSTPSEALDVSGKIKISDETISTESVTFDGSTAAGLRLYNSDGYLNLTPLNSGWVHFYTDRSNFILRPGTSSGGVWSYYGKFSSYNDNDLFLQTHGTTRMLIDRDTGNIGIATTTPSYKLDVSGTGRFTQPVVVGTPTDDTHATTKSYVDSAASSGGQWTDNGSYIYANNSSDVVVTDSGDVGIGTTTPSTKLYVSGDSTMDGDVYLNNNKIYTENTQTNMVMRGVNNTEFGGLPNDGWGYVSSDGSAQQAYIYSDTTGASPVYTMRTSEDAGSTWEEQFAVSQSDGTNIKNLRLTGDTDRILTTNGNSDKYLVLGNNAARTAILGAKVYDSSDNYDYRSYFANNAYWDSADRVWKPLRTSLGRRSMLSMGYQQDAFKFQVDNNATTTISWTDLMTIEFDGNVGIGDTTPSYKLDVSGTGRFTQPVIVGTPTADTHATTKSYVDSTVTGGSSDASYNTLSVSGTTTLATTNGRVGIGTIEPSQELDIVGDINLEDTTSNDTGVIYKDGVRFIHNFNYGDNGTVTTDGYNTFIGKNAGNFTMGSTATETYQSSNNTAVGYQSLQGNTTGYRNTAVGYQSLQGNTTGRYNTALGRHSLRNNNTGDTNVALGYDSLYNNNTGYDNTAVGGSSLQNNTTGYQNTALGRASLYSNTTGYRNTALGNYAGRYIADGSTANETSNNSIYLGSDTKALADGDTNEIVIGYNATGIGSNSVVLGNDSITTTALKGNVGIGDITPESELDVNGEVSASMYYDKDDPNYYIDPAANLMAHSAVLGGNVGIGVTTPDTLLSLANDSWISAKNSAGTGYINMFKVNSSNEIEVGGTLNIGTIGLAEDSGVVTMINMPVSSAPSAGTEESYSFSIDSDPIMKIYSEADGSGGVQNMRVGIGTSTPGSTLTVDGDLLVTGTILGDDGNDEFTGTISSGNVSSGQFGSNTGGGNYSFPNDLAVDTNTLYVDASENKVGIGVTDPSTALEINGVLSFSGLGGGTAIDLGSNDLIGVDKLTVATIDPLYRINDVNYATYAATLAGGVYEEVTGILKLEKSEEGLYKHVIDFNNGKVGSKLWLFNKVTDFGENWENLTVIISPEVSGGFWDVGYEKDIDNNKLIIYGRGDRFAGGNSEEFEVSYRLTSKRFDHKDWPIKPDNQSETPNFIIE